MFTLKNYIFDEEDLNKFEDKKIYIDLNLELEEMTSVELLEGNFDLKNVHIQNNQQKRLADEVAIDINELQSLRSTRKNVKVYGDSIRYSAQIRKEWLASIETIFGDADLQALDDFSCLASLKAIYGDLNLAQCKDTEVDLSGLQVQMVYGDIHAERAKSTAGLENLLSVGGTIYYQGQDYSLEQFQQLIAADTKERQK